MVWNSLPTEFRDLSVSFDVFRRTVKTILFARYQCIQRNIRDVSMILRYINFRYLSIYLSIYLRYDSLTRSVKPRVFSVVYHT